ncbi:MAG: energy transducer TonB [Bacteroidota bacterium]
MKSLILLFCFALSISFCFGQTDTLPEFEDELFLEVHTSVSGLGGRMIEQTAEVYLDELETAIEGVVVVRICVDAAGNVTDANYTMQGSTTSSPSLIDLAIESAREFKFEESLVDKHCGRISYLFKLE